MPSVILTFVLIDLQLHYDGNDVIHLTASHFDEQNNTRSQLVVYSDLVNKWQGKFAEVCSR